MTRKRYSPQRDLICTYVKRSTRHPTAETIYQALRLTTPGLSRGTVYRNLGILADEGKITRMPFPIERYDGNTAPHAHLVCSSCGCVSDLKMPYNIGLDQTASQLGHCKVQRHECYFYGQCSACLETPSEESETTGG